MTLLLGCGNSRGGNQTGTGIPTLQRRLSDESIQSGMTETQEMQTIQVCRLLFILVVFHLKSISFNKLGSFVSKLI